MTYRSADPMHRVRLAAPGRTSRIAVTDTERQHGAATEETRESLTS